MDVIELTASEVTKLLELLSVADRYEHPVRVAVDGDGFKIKVGEGMWSPPLGMGA